MYLDLSYRADGTGRTATTEAAARRVRNLIEAVLFTAPGERLNRPDFGSGIHEMLFDGNSEALATAADFLIRAAVHRHLAELVTIEALSVQRTGGELRVTLVYVVTGEDERRSDSFVRGV